MASQRTRAILVGATAIVLFTCAILIWLDRTGQISLFASGTTREIKQSVRSEADWKQGQFNNVGFVNGALRLIAAGNTNIETTPSSNTQSSTSISVKTIEQAGAVALVPKSSGHCLYESPKDWAALTDDSGSGIDILKSDSSMYAGWSIWPVDRSGEQYYGAQFGDPDASNLALVNKLLRGGGYVADAQYTGSNQSVMSGLFTVRPWRSSQKTGLVLYHIYPKPDVSVAYIASRYVAATDTAIWQQDGGTAVAVALSIRCTSQLRPSSSAGSTGASGAAKDNADGISESDYNAQLGIETVHDPDTGENYTVNRVSAYNDNGPYGPGYYKAVGNDVKKLELGIQY